MIGGEPVSPARLAEWCAPGHRADPAGQHLRVHRDDARSRTPSTCTGRGPPVRRPVGHDRPGADRLAAAPRAWSTSATRASCWSAGRRWRWATAGCPRRPRRGSSPSTRDGAAYFRTGDRVSRSGDGMLGSRGPARQRDQDPWHPGRPGRGRGADRRSPGVGAVAVARRHGRRSHDAGGVRRAPAARRHAAHVGRRRAGLPADPRPRAPRARAGSTSCPSSPTPRAARSTGPDPPAALGQRPIEEHR